MTLTMETPSRSDSFLRPVQDYFQQLTSGVYDPWVILVELLLIGTVVYCTLRFLRGTRGARLMRGITIVAVSSFVVVRMLAERFHWERIEFLYQYFVIAVFLIALIVFQPELRRAFMRMGERLWFRGWRRHADKMIEPIVQAASSLSKKRIGALIAVERLTSHGALIESGVALDAKLSVELLSTIFWPGSALHDLAVFVRHDRILAAGCQLPLIETGDHDRGLGSRHRAALGLSHESDAVVVVVSEETGAISVAHKGQLSRDLTTDVLRLTLYELLAYRSEAATPSDEPAPHGESFDSHTALAEPAIHER